MILTLYYTGRPLALLGYYWAKATRHGTIVQYGSRFRVRETPEQIEALDKKDDDENRQV